MKTVPKRKKSGIRYDSTPSINPDLTFQCSGCRHKCWGCDGQKDGVLEMTECSSCVSSNSNDAPVLCYIQYL